MIFISGYWFGRDEELMCSASSEDLNIKTIRLDFIKAI